MRPDPIDNDIEAYQGNDMVGYIIEKGFSLPKNAGAIRSIVNVREMAIIVTDYYVYRAKPEHYSGFCIEQLSYL